MIHVFKQDKDGAWKDEAGRSYSIQTCSKSEAKIYVLNGWFYTLEEAFNKPLIESPKDNDGDEPMSDYESQLRDKIKALGGRAGGRSKIETLEKQLAELEAE